MPMFMSVRCLTKSEHERLIKVYTAITAAIEAVPG